MLERCFLWVKFTFRFPVFERLWRYLIFLALYSTGVVLFEDIAAPLLGAAPPAPHVAEVVLTSLVFGWLLNFRTNTAYDRWYEARRLWGTLVNISRNIVLKSGHLVRPDSAEHDRMRELVGEFAFLLRRRLGGLEASQDHLPMRATGAMYDLLHDWSRAGRVAPWAALSLDNEIRQMMDVAGACERIRSTPLTASYRGLLRKGIGIYLLVVPWLTVGDIGYFSILSTLLIGYALIALELVADDIENPFGYGPDDLPLDDVVKIIQNSAGDYVPRLTESTPRLMLDGAGELFAGDLGASRGR